MQKTSTPLANNTLVRILPQGYLGVIIGKDRKTGRYEVLIEDGIILQLHTPQLAIVSWRLVHGKK